MAFIFSVCSDGAVLFAVTGSAVLFAEFAEFTAAALPVLSAEVAGAVLSVLTGSGVLFAEFAVFAVFEAAALAVLSAGAVLTVLFPSLPGALFSFISII